MRAARAGANEGQRLGERRFGRVAELVRVVVAGRAVNRQAVKEVAFEVRVLDRERDRIQHLVAESETVLADRLAVGCVADDRDRHVRRAAS